MQSWQHWLFAAVAYLVGSFPTGVVLSRSRFGIDVREMGSGNIGATNITRVFGWYAGALTLAFDFVKGWLPVFLAHRFVPEDPWTMTIVGVAAVLGHCFSVFLKLRGGKGVATGFGAIVAASPYTGLVAAGAYAIGIGVSRISAVGSLLAVVAACLYLSLSRPGAAIECLVFAVCGLVLIRHRTNIARLSRTLRDRRKKKG